MKYLIVGAVAGGASAAARLRRLQEKAEIILFERGAHISYANCGLPYYIGNVIKQRDALFVQTANAFHQRFAIDIRTNTEVVTINPQQKKVTAKNLITGHIYEETYDKLILSPGAEPVRPPLPGIDLPGILTLRNVGDTDKIKNHISHNNIKEVLVVGAGFIGLEMAENLQNLGLNVTVVEMGNQILAPLDFEMAAIVQLEMRKAGVKLLTNTAVSSFAAQDENIIITTHNGNQLQAQLVILSIGVRPDVKLARVAGLRTGPSGAIWVNEYLQTSNEHIYAVGDAIEYTNPISGKSMPTYLAGPANKQGRICATNVARGNTLKYTGAVNTAIVQVFGLTAATAGMAAKHLDAANIEHIVSITHGGSHAGYYPGAQQLTIQLAFAPYTGRLLGAQVVGAQGVDKRIDILSLLIQQQKTIYELATFEHAYAPPYSSAKDPVNMAAFVAENILLDNLQVYYWQEANNPPADTQLIDVRTKEEFEAGCIPYAINIPIDEIRERLHEIPTNSPIYVYCEAGMRGYLAQRILSQSGYNHVKNLSGGYKHWKNSTLEHQYKIN